MSVPNGFNPTFKGIVTAAGFNGPNVNDTVGNVYYVIQKSKAFYNTFIASHQMTYQDGSVAVYGDDGDGLGIQAAINACKGGRNDYVLVGTGNYNLTVALTTSGKSSVHLIGVNGVGCEVGTVGASALTQTGAYENVIMEAYGELAGFQIINKAGYSAVTMANGKWRANIHNNWFHMVQGTACNIIETAGSGMSYGTIANNRFQTYVGGAISSAIYLAGPTACQISGNWINNSSGTMDTAINLYAGVQNLIIDNMISDCTGAGTITNGVTLGAGASGFTAVGNRFVMPTGSAFSGGTANRTFCQNFDAQAGGETAIES